MKVVLMKTRDGVALLLDGKDGFFSSNPEAILAALKEDMISKDQMASDIARRLWIQISLSGGIKELSRLF